MAVDEKVNQFLRELTELSKRYGIYIKGRGCCGSSWLSDNHVVIDECLEYGEESGRYKTLCYDGEVDD